MGMTLVRHRQSCQCSDGGRRSLQCPVHGDGALNDQLADYAEISAFLSQGSQPWR